ncbi:hypothetical protein EI77_04671 [Prosthecobacter fusiformis]|uniref:Uncharacterized protein n=1 Tax=Prosthecobacter fusiformis TaxID=48464 RepID=A0A4R7RJN1_9BACT|nr:hypothetical protein [Prosthecobacter fusiformis]TDU62506.1 hypothetical protein EI77_04671 [Prosthecobacter fusiformis]
MNHPLISELQTLASLLEKHPQQAASKQAIILLDKVAKAVRSSIELIKNAALGESPEIQEVLQLLKQVREEPLSEAAVKTMLRPLLKTMPAKKAGADYLAVLASSLEKAGQAAAAKSMLRHHLDRPRFDPSAKTEYELLKQIRNLGQMDASQQKAAKDYLIAKPDLVSNLCEAASISTVKKGKTPGPVPVKKLVDELVKQGKRYAENSSR